MTGCGGTQEEPEPTETLATEATEEQSVRNEDWRSTVMATVSGDHEFSWEGEQIVRITRAGQSGLAVNLLSVGMVVPQQLPNTRDYFRWAFDMVNEFKDEPGTYTLAPPQEGAQISSNAFVLFIRAKEGAPLPPTEDAHVEEFLEYLKVLQPCTVTIVDAAGLKGAISCPELALEDGSSVALEATWEAQEQVEGTTQ